MATEIRTRLTADTTGFQASMQKAQKTATTTTGKMKSSFSGVSASMGAMVKGAGAIGLALGALEAVASLISGPALSNVEINFAKVANSVGADADKMMAALKSASLGMVSDMELMTQASQAMTLGINPELIVQMMEAATASSKTMGITVSHAFESIAIGVARQSRLILDNVGIIVKADEAYENYAKSIGVTVDQLTQAEKTIAFNQAAMVGLKKQVEVVGATTEGTMGETAKFLTTIRNMWNHLGDAVKSFIDTALKPVNWLLEKMRNNLENSGVYKFKVEREDPDGIMNAGYINGNGVQAKQDRKQTNSSVAQEKKDLAAILKAREDFAVKFAALQEGEQAKDLVKLAQWRDKQLSLVGATAEDRKNIEQIYQMEKAEIVMAAGEQLDNLIAEQSEKRVKTEQEQKEIELEELELWYEQVMELTSEGDEQRLEALEIYLDRRRVLTEEAKDREYSTEKSFIENARVLDQNGADFAKAVTKDKWETISFLGDAALKTGTTLGKKIFLATQAVAAAECIVDTSKAIMKTLAFYGGTPWGYANAAVVAAVGAAQLASIVSGAIGSTSSADTSSSSGSVSTGTTSVSDVTPEATETEEEKGSLTINIQGDIMNEDYVDLLAERINEAVQDRNVLLKATTAREVSG